jgi:NAD-dependent deacetylase
MSRSGAEALSSLLERCRRAVVFTGAGISTESGIPDFRSPTGMWAKTTPVYFQDFVASEDARRRAWRQKLEVQRDMKVAKPNRGHRAVAELVRQEKVVSVITQNIDGLHQDSGVPDEVIIELHGNGTYATCLECGLRHELAPILESFEADESLPACASCSGMVKTATVSFGQSMPQAAMARPSARPWWSIPQPAFRCSPSRTAPGW